MDKKTNKIHNCIGFIALLVGVVCLILSAMLLPALNKKKAFEIIIGLIGITSSTVFVAVEMLQFLLFYTRYRLLYIFCLIISLTLIITINMMYPFMGVGVIILAQTICSITRIIFSEKLYVPKRYDGYLKMFGLKKKKKRKAPVKQLKPSQKALIAKTSRKLENSTKKKSTTKKTNKKKTEKKSTKKKVEKQNDKKQEKTRTNTIPKNAIA